MDANPQKKESNYESDQKSEAFAKNKFDHKYESKIIGF